MEWMGKRREIGGVMLEEVERNSMGDVQNHYLAVFWCFAVLNQFKTQRN